MRSRRALKQLGALTPGNRADFTEYKATKDEMGDGWNVVLVGLVWNTVVADHDTKAQAEADADARNAKKEIEQ